MTAGLDVEAGGSWLGANDDGVVAGVLNRTGTLGPQAGMRSRGELVLDALDHADARDAAAALARIDGRAYRTFNLVIADNRDAFLLCHRGAADGRVDVAPIGPGLSMITSLELNDPASPRIAGSLDRFRAAAAPDPEAGDWSGWINLLADRSRHLPDDPGSALTIVTDHGYGTVSSSLIALPEAVERRAAWLFSAGAPDRAPWYPVGIPAETRNSRQSVISGSLTSGRDPRGDASWGAGPASGSPRPEALGRARIACGCGGNSGTGLRRPAHTVADRCTLPVAAGTAPACRNLSCRARLAASQPRRRVRCPRYQQGRKREFRAGPVSVVAVW